MSCGKCSAPQGKPGFCLAAFAGFRCNRPSGRSFLFIPRIPGLKTPLLLLRRSRTKVGIARGGVRTRRGGAVRICYAAEREIWSRLWIASPASAEKDTGDRRAGREDNFRGLSTKHPRRIKDMGSLQVCKSGLHVKVIIIIRVLYR